MSRLSEVFRRTVAAVLVVSMVAAHAALPALAFSWAVDTVGPAVVQAVGRQAVMTVGVAANDGAFIATATEWGAVARAAAVLVLPWISGETVEVPFTPESQTSEMTHAPKSVPQTINQNTRVARVHNDPYMLPGSWFNSGLGMLTALDLGPDEVTTFSAVAIRIAVIWNSHANPSHQILASDIVFSGDYYGPGEEEGTKVFIWGRVPKFDAEYQAFHNQSDIHVEFFANVGPVEEKDLIRRAKIVAGGWQPDLSDPDWTDQDAANWPNARSIQVSDNVRALGLTNASSGVALTMRIQKSYGVQQQQVIFNSIGIPVSQSITNDAGLLEDLPSGDGSTAGGSAAVCGGPGLPDCAVRINEEGVTSNGSISTSAFDAAGQAAAAQVTNAGSRTVLPFVWSPLLPQGACEDVVFNVHGMTTTLDWCQYLPWFRSLIGWLYGFLTGLYCWRKVTEV